MKSYFYLTILICFTMLSCGGRIENKKIGLYVDKNGLKPETLRVLSNQQLKQDKNVSFGDQLTIEVLGIDDFEMISKTNCLPGAEYAVSDEQGELVYLTKDLFTKYASKGVNIEDAKLLKLNLSIGKPMEQGKKYFFLFRIWDKNSDKELKGNLELNVL